MQGPCIQASGKETSLRIEPAACSLTHEHLYVFYSEAYWMVLNKYIGKNSTCPYHLRILRNRMARSFRLLTAPPTGTSRIWILDNPAVVGLRGSGENELPSMRKKRRTGEISHEMTGIWSISSTHYYQTSKVWTLGRGMDFSGQGIISLPQGGR